ncbi:unnamed protein product [Leptosia nina]|uniref:Uncharacterized protein n=1 Tax=Leptosia nina TaxID=320188 RepID=A0AAV1IYL1_9NEOP
MKRAVVQPRNYETIAADISPPEGLPLLSANIVCQDISGVDCARQKYPTEPYKQKPSPTVAKSARKLDERSIGKVSLI